MIDPDAWASAHLRRANGFAWLALRLFCTGEGFVAFTRVYGYFRWADDVVDAPDRDRARVAAFVDRQRAIVAGASPEEPPERALALALAASPWVRPAVERMWEALAFDAARDATPLTSDELAAQVARVGDAYLAALWACAGEAGDPPGGLAALSRAATLAHVLRDVEVDRRLGYVNVTDAAATASEAARLFAEGDRALATLPWGRARLLVGLLAWRYRRLLARAVSPGPPPRSGTPP
ncbi:MAG: squalene/phytoene synthase family protein [Myxococcota bacterium]